MKKMIDYRTAAGLVILALCATVQAREDAFPASQKVSFDITAPSMVQALIQFTQQSGLQLAFPTKGTDDLPAPQVVGEYTPAAALDQLLKNSGLRYEFANERTVSVHTVDARSALRPPVSNIRLADASGRPSTSSAGATPDGGTSLDSAESSEAGESGAAATKKVIPEILVTGSRLKRESNEGAAPVTILDRNRIDQLGVTSVAAALDYLPQQPFGASEVQNTAGSRQIRLRGLGVGTTLVLINGRRTVTSALQASSSYFDLNTIPLAAVDRMEILSDSASAVYGADAIGGVLNIIMKRQIERPVVDLYYGTTHDGFAKEKRADLTFGFTGSRIRASSVLSFYDRSPLLGEDRDLTADQDYRRFGSADRRTTFSNPGNITSLTSANLPGLPSRFAAVPVGSSGVGLTPTDFLATAGQRNLESLSRFRSLLPDAERLSAVASAEFDATATTTAFAEVMYAHMRDVTLLQPPILNATVPAANPFNPFGVAVSANYLFTGIGTQEAVSKVDSYRFVAGMKGSLKLWDWELSILGIKEMGSSETTNAVDSVRASAALSATDPAQALNVFQDGPGASASVLSSLVTTSASLDNSSGGLQEGVFVRGPIIALPAGDLTAVLGGEFRREKVGFAAPTSRIFLSPDRRSSAAYSELAIPIISRRMQLPLVDRLSLTLAGRYDDYSDFGSAFNPQYGVEWNPLSSLLLRASYGTSFRPPSLFQLYRPQTQLQSSIVDVHRNNQLTPYTSISGGNSALSAEEANSLTTGFVLTLGDERKFRVAATYWSIDQDRRVQALNANILLANESLFPDRVVRDVPTAADTLAGLPGRLRSIDTTNINFGRVETSGVDLEVSSSFVTSIGRLTPGISSTWVRRYRAANLPNVASVDRVGVANVDGTIPKWRATGTFAWSRGPVGASLAARYFTSYDDVSISGVRNGRSIPSQTLVDVQAFAHMGDLSHGASSWIKGFDVRIGVSNVFNRDPSFAEVDGSGYDFTQADMRGRFGYLLLSKNF